MTEITTDMYNVPDLQNSTSFHAGMVQLYRGEMQRMTVWRSRLDTTSHWAIIVIAGLTTFALGTPQVPHFVMLLGLAFNSIFLVIEGRRYLHLHHSRWRVSLLEQNYFTVLLGGNMPDKKNWSETLRRDLMRPHFTISLRQGVLLRLRRNYLMLYFFVTAVWLSKLLIHPTRPSDLTDFYHRLAVGDLFPSWFVALMAGLFMTILTGLAIITPSEETLENWTHGDR